MGKYSLEEYFKNRVKGHKETIDKDALWHDLGLEKKPRKRRLWIIPLCVGLLVGIFNIWPFQQEKTSPELSSVVNEANTLQNENEAQIRNATSSNVQSNMDIEPHKENDLINNIATDRKTEPQNESRKSKNASNSFAGTAGIESIENAGLNPLIQKPVLQTTGEAKPHVESKISKLGQLNTTSSVAVDRTDTAKDNVDPVPTVTWTKLLEKLPFLAFVLDLPKKRNTPRLNSALMERNLIEPSVHHNPWHISANNSYYLTARDIRFLDFEGPAPDQDREHLDARNRTETMLESRSVGAELTYTFPFNIYIGSGVEYLQVNERFNVQISTDSTFIQEDEPVIFIIESNGDTLATAFEDVEISSKKTAIWENYNSHTFVNIPMIIGYQHQWNTWSFFAEGASLLSFYTGAEGKMLHVDNDAVIDVASQFNPSIELMTRCRAGLAYKLTNRLDVAVHVAGIFQTTGIAQQGLWFNSQRYRMAGAGLNLRYNFQ